MARTDSDRPKRKKRGETLALAKEAGRAAAQIKAQKMDHTSADDLPETWDPTWSVRLPEVIEQDAPSLKEVAVRAAAEYWDEYVSDRRDEDSIERE